MLVKYVMNSTVTNSDIIADINGIITGTITSNASLSGSANASATKFYGTYPTGVYTVANSSAYAYNKKHSANNSVSMFFRLDLTSNRISSITYGRLYSNSTNSFSAASNNWITISASPNIGETNTNIKVLNEKCPIDILVNDNMFLISQTGLGTGFQGIFDLGYDQMSKTYTDQMINAVFDDSTLTTSYNIYNLYMYRVLDSTLKNFIYSYGLNAFSNGTTQTSYIVPYTSPNTVYGANLTIYSNPVFFGTPENGNTSTLIYGLNVIAPAKFANKTVYGSSGDYRYVICPSLVGGNTFFSIPIS